MLYLNYLFLIFEWSACKLAGQAKCNFHYKQALLLFLFFYTFACSYLYNYNNSDCEAYICRTFNNSRFIMSFATGKQATNIQIGPPVMPFSPTKTSEKCSVPSNPDVHSLSSEDSDELETTLMDELVAPSLCTVEDADVTCISEEEEEQQPSYESAEESDFTPSDMQSEDGDTSDDLDEKDEKPEADEEIVRTFLPPYWLCCNFG